MKKIYLVLIGFSLALLVSCSNDDSFKIGVDFYPMPELVELIADDLKNDGINVKLVRMNYNLLNTPLSQGEIEGNMSQHQHFLKFYNDANNNDLVIAQPIYHSKFAIYSNVFKSIDDIPQGETIYIPLDIVNISRALLLMESFKLIKLKDGVTTSATLDDIEENYKSLNIETKALDVTPLSYKDSGRRLAIMYPSYARQAIGLEDDSEFLFQEILDEVTKTYAISLAIRKTSLEDERLLTFIEHLTSDKVRNWIIENYGWAAIPAF